MEEQSARRNEYGAIDVIQARHSAQAVKMRSAPAGAVIAVPEPYAIGGGIDAR